MSKTAIRQFQKVTHCIFDMDGLLLDTERLYTQATQTILDKYDKTYTWEVKMTLMGLHHREVAQRIVDIYELPMTWEEYSELQSQTNQALMINAELMPDTEPIYEEIVRQIACSCGKEYPFDVRMKLLGTTEQRSARIAIDEMKLPLTIEEYMKQFHSKCRAMLGNTNLLKGAERLLRHLHANEVPIALATSSGEEMVNLKTTNHRELFALFNHRVCGSTDKDVKEGKPAPDIFLVAAERFPQPADPAMCLVFEDAPNGVRAAHDAGMQSVMVPDVRVPKEMCSLSTLVLKSLEDFKPESFGLPPFEC